MNTLPDSLSRLLIDEDRKHADAVLHQDIKDIIADLPKAIGLLALIVLATITYCAL